MEYVGCIVLLVLAMTIAPLLVALAAFSRLNKLEREVRELKSRLGPVVPQPAPATQTSPPIIEQPVSAPPPIVPPPLPAPPIASPREPFNWESLVGVKLFAWIGGLAFFLGVVFFVKYAFENNLVTPVMRIAIGAVVGVLLVCVGAFSATRRYRVPAQSLCATGLLVLYADIYAAHALYALVSLTAASLLMCVVTAVALWLATHLDAQSVVWLAALGGYLTPGLFWSGQSNALVLFGYIALLNFAFAILGNIKQWRYLVLLAAIATVASEIGWATDFFGPAHGELTRRVLLLFQAQFLAICVARERVEHGDNWSASALALLAGAALLFCIAAADEQQKYTGEFVYPVLFFTNVALLALAAVRREHVKPDRVAAALAFTALALTWLAEWGWHYSAFGPPNAGFAVIWYIAIALLFVAAPYFCGTDRLWPWSIVSAGAALQFWFVYRLIVSRFPHVSPFVLPLVFAAPLAGNLAYLVRRLLLPLASADTRLATQIVGLLFFISLVCPVQFKREWITLGWAIEGVALLVAYRFVPNAQLRIIALLVASAAFARLTFNPAVFEYHKRTPLRIWNWYLYAYGITALCLFTMARLYRDGTGDRLTRVAHPLLYSMATLLLFLLLNIEIADYFSLGPTLTFAFTGDFARDMTYSIAWALFAFALLLIGIFRDVRAVRFSAMALLCLTLAKLFLHDLDQLSQLYRVAAFLAVAAIAVVASFAYQRFLSPRAQL